MLCAYVCVYVYLLWHIQILIRWFIWLFSYIGFSLFCIAGHFCCDMKREKHMRVSVCWTFNTRNKYTKNYYQRINDLLYLIFQTFFARNWNVSMGRSFHFKFYYSFKRYTGSACWNTFKSSQLISVSLETNCARIDCVQVQFKYVPRKKIFLKKIISGCKSLVIIIKHRSDEIKRIFSRDRFLDHF